MAQLKWKRAYPACEGFFFYRLNMSEEPEVIEVYRAGRRGSIHRYSWSDENLLVGKRMHDPAAVAADELSGFYLVPEGSKDPAPIVLLKNSATVTVSHDTTEQTEPAPPASVPG